jgi:hypothetical protein
MGRSGTQKCGKLCTGFIRHSIESIVTRCYDNGEDTPWSVSEENYLISWPTIRLSIWILLLGVNWLIMLMGEATSLNCGHQWVSCSSPGCCMSIGSHGGIMSREENFWFFRQISLTILPAVI